MWKSLYSVKCWWECETSTKWWKIIQKCSWIGSINIVKISTASKAIYRHNAIYIKVSMIFSPNWNNPKFIWDTRPQIAKANDQKQQNSIYHALWLQTMP